MICKSFFFFFKKGTRLLFSLVFEMMSALEGVLDICCVTRYPPSDCIKREDSSGTKGVDR